MMFADGIVTCAMNDVEVIEHIHEWSKALD